MTESEDSNSLKRERLSLLVQLEDLLDGPLLVLSFVWLVLFILELVRGLSPLLGTLTTIIWSLFVVDFTVRLLLAPDKTAYLRRNWLTALGLALPALRLLRLTRLLIITRAVRTARGMRLLSVLSSTNRSMRALRATLRRRRFSYILALTLIVTATGAAGMTALEGGSFQDFAFSLWWTAMIMTTMGSERWPQTGEGRLLCLLLALYAFTMFGYVTAALASFFVGQDKEAQPAAAERNE